MSPETEAKIDLALLALEIMQRTGQAPPPGEVSLDTLVRISEATGHPVSKSTWHSYATLAFEKAAHNARQRGREHFLSPEP